MTDQKPRQVYDDNGRPVYGDDGKPLLETATVPQDAPTGRGQHPLGGLGRGITQSVMGTLIPIADLANRGVSALGLTERIQPEVFSAAGEHFATPRTPHETMGYVAGELGQFATPGAGMAKGARLIPRAAMAIERKAVPALTKAGAEQVLSRGVGRISTKNAKALATEAKATRAEIPKFNARKNEWGYTYGDSPLDKASTAMSEAVRVRRPALTTPEIAMSVGGGLLLQNPAVTAAIGASRLLARPRVSSAIAQGLYSAAPTMNVVGGGGATLALAEYLKSLFGGDE